MTHANQNPPPTPPAFTHDELVLLNNALNEVCNGLPFGDDEFQTRIGYPRAMAQTLLKKVAKALGRPT
jgi:hypothetical protein